MPDTINVAQLNRLIGTHDAPVIVDVRRSRGVHGLVGPLQTQPQAQR